jgi:hypothetical protein
MKDSFLGATFGKDMEMLPTFENLEERIERIREQPFFTVDGKTWTVRDFEHEIEKHPLVFREKEISKKEFPEQLKFAIADMMRDLYITKEAYKKGYDKVNIVRREMDMWKDAWLAQYQKQKYLEELDVNYKDTYKMLDYLNPYIDELQKKYSDTVEINFEEFDKIKLTRIDMLATYTNLPFTVVSPSFPILTTKHKFDYGKKME